MHFLLLANWMQKVVVVPTLREEAAFCGVVVNWHAKSTFRRPECSLCSQGNLDTPQRSFSSIEKKQTWLPGFRPPRIDNFFSHYNFQACKANNLATQWKAERSIVHFTVTGENEAGGDRLLIQPISFIIVIMFFLCETVFCSNFDKKGKEVCINISSNSASHSLRG